MTFLCTPNNFHWLIMQIKRIALILVSSFILILLLIPLVRPLDSDVAAYNTPYREAHNAIVFDASCSPFGSLVSCVEVQWFEGE